MSTGVVSKEEANPYPETNNNSHGWLQHVGRLSRFFLGNRLPARCHVS